MTTKVPLIFFLVRLWGWHRENAGGLGAGAREVREAGAGAGVLPAAYVYGAGASSLREVATQK